MKKTLLLASLVLALSLGASAQYRDFSFGFKLGPGFDWTGSTTGAAVNQGVRAGFGLGVVAEYYFTDNYAIVSGINVNMLRGHYSFTNAHMVDAALVTFPVDRYYKSTVFEIPVMLKMITNQLGALPFRYYAQMGAGIGYAHKVMVRDGNNGAAAPEAYGTSNKEFSNLRFGLKIGAGAQYSIDESLRVFAGIYYSHDFINNINYIKPNHYANYYDAELVKIGERDTKLNLLQNRFGIEVGVLF